MNSRLDNPKVPQNELLSTGDIYEQQPIEHNSEQIQFSFNEGINIVTHNIHSASQLAKLQF